jgi:hypothetical protein
MSTVYLYIAHHSESRHKNSDQDEKNKDVAANTKSIQFFSPIDTVQLPQNLE